jgi:Zn-dependent metalloprotease/plastocyanin
MATSAWAAKKVDLLSANSAGYIQKMNNQGDHGRSAMASIFGLTTNEKLAFKRQTVDFNSISHARYQQTYKGIPIWGHEVVVSRDHTDQVLKLDGAVVFDIPRDILGIPGTLDPDGALIKMKKAHQKKDLKAKWNFNNERTGTYIYLDKNSKANVVYAVSFFADNEKGKPSRPVFFIDARSGKVIDYFENLQTGLGTGPGGNLKTGQYTYNDNGGTYPGFGVTVNGTTCTMNTTNVKTVDLNHGTSGTTAYSYTCYNNTHENINGGYCPMNDAQYFGQMVYDMYQNWYGLAVLPFQLMMRCHYSTNYENAFWNGSSMTFGDGYTTFYPLVSLDVSAHEVSHGFTENHSNLTYSGQSGGMNESFSDMAGEASEYYMKGSNDFKVGFEIFKSANAALRYMYDPPLDGMSIDHVSEYYSGLDVHYSSGIYNKVFYLVAVSPGWTTRMAFDIFTKANTDYWTASETFVSGAEDVRQAALDYGYNCADVAAAFTVVGITITTCPATQPPVANFTGTPLTGPAPLTVVFTDTSSNTPTSWSWNFGDGGTSTLKNPSHQYTTQGTYTVTLTAANAYGSDSETKTNYITVTAPQAPVAAFVGSPTTVSVGGTVTFTDQSTNSPTSWAWTFEGGTPATSTAQNPTVTYSAAGTYDVTLVATNAQGSDTEAKIDYITVTSVSYCASQGNSQTYEWISRVRVANLDNSSGASKYSNFTSLSATLTRGVSASVTLNTTYSGTIYTEYWRIWVDYNKDGDFVDTGEQVFSKYGRTSVTGSFTPPTSALTGATRMRVSMRYGGYPTSCLTFSYGEVEDYTANIL